MRSMSRTLLKQIFQNDRLREGAIETNYTCTADGHRTKTRQEAVEELHELGLIVYGSHFLDITDAGIAEAKALLEEPPVKKRRFK